MPTRPTVKRSSVIPILEAIRDWLVACEVKTADQVYFSAKPIDVVPFTMGDSDLVFQPGRFLPTGNEEGAGRYDTRVRRILSVFVRSRCELDEQDREDMWLLGDDEHFALEEAVINALHLCPTEDKDGNILLVEPMRLSPSGEPKRNKANKGWGVTELEFELVYMLDLDLSGIGGEPTNDGVSSGGSSGGSGGGGGSDEEDIELVADWFWGFY